MGLTGSFKMKIVPISLDEANHFVLNHHRHHSETAGHKFSIALSDESGVVHGVAIVGRPVSRLQDDGWTLEVYRCCVDGISNGCSMLYRAAWRAALALGYTKLITYTLQEEGSKSLCASGFKLLGKTGGGTWDRPLRPRIDKHPLEPKLKWELAI